MSVENLSGVKVEIGFGVNAVGGDFFILDGPVKGELDGATYLLAPDTVFVDITEHVAAVMINRGRDRETDEYSTGKVSVVINDNDRTFDPAHPGSPYAGQLTPMRRVRITWQGHHLFNGWIDDWSVVYEPGDALARTTADGMDSFGVLGTQELAEIAAAFSGDTSGQRVTRVLDRPEVDFPASRSIDAGLSTFGATTLGGNALAYLQACAAAEAGYLFVASDGTLTFRERTAVLNAPTGVTFTDDRTAGIPYRTITQRSAADLLYTRVTATSETTDVEVEAVDVAAGREFLVRTLPLGTLFTIDDVQTQTLVDAYLERFVTPEVRFESATVNVLALSTSEVAQVAALDLTDVVTVTRWPMPDSFSLDPFTLSAGGYVLDDLLLLDLDGGGYEEAA